MGSQAEHRKHNQGEDNSPPQFGDPKNISQSS